MLFIHPPVVYGSQSEVREDSSLIGSGAVKITVKMQSSEVLTTEHPVALLTIVNLSSEEVSYPRIRVSARGLSGEPETTRLQRQMSDRLRPHENSLREDISAMPIEPGQSLTLAVDLSAFYDLSKVGTYTIRVEVQDVAMKSNTYWLRAPDVKLTVKK